MRRLLLLCLLFLPLFQSPGVGQVARHLNPVIGEGNRLSGRVRIAHLGSAGDDLGREIDRFVRLVRERTGLDLTATHLDSLAGGPPDAEILLHPVELSFQDALAVEQYDHRRVGLAHAVPAGEAPTSEMLVRLFRYALQHSPGIRHLRTVYESIGWGVEGERLTIRAETILPGELTVAVLTVDGAEVIPERPLRPLDLGKIRDRENAIVRLRWRGEGGLADEKRIWLPDLAPGLATTVELFGTDTAWVGLPWRCRVVVRRGPVPIPGVAVAAKLSDRELRATTGPAGAAVFEFSPFEAVADGQAPLHVEVLDPRFPHRLRDFIGIAPRKVTAHLLTDRPVYRPGSRVRLRAVVVDSFLRHGVADRALGIRMLDPRGRMLASDDAVTDERGVATFELPLADGIAEGGYRAVVTGEETEDALSAECTFRVEELVLPPFEVEVEPGKEVFGPGETVFGTVRARALTGESIGRVQAECRWRTGRKRGFRLGADGTGTFRIEPPSRRAGRAEPLTVRVLHGGRWVAREVSIAFAAPDRAREEKPRRAIEAPDMVPVGSVLPIRVRLDGEDGPVLLDLVSGLGLLAAASGEIRSGSTDLAIQLPDRFAGPVLLVATRPGGKPVTLPVTVADPIDVHLELTTTEAEPGEQVGLRVHVTDDGGQGLPAVLDVRGFDRAYLAASEGTGDAVPLLMAGCPREGLRLLAARTPVDAYHGFNTRGEAAAKPVLDEALRRLAAGRDIGDLRLPWGARLSAWKEGKRVHVAGEAAITTREPNRDPPPFVRVLPPDPSASGPLRAPLECLSVAYVVPPQGGRAGRSGDTVDHGLGWLPFHQSPDGSFDPVAFTRMCAGSGCGGEGDPRMRPGTTGVVLLACLGAGETHKHGRYKRVVREGLKFLKRTQGKEGLFGDPASDWARLNHAMATLAMCEAYGMTLSPLFKSSAQRGVNVLAAFQREDGAFSEQGWKDGSLILTAWSAAALGSARISGLTVPEGATGAITRWVDANAGAGTGVVHCSAQEIDEYPFATPHLSPGPEGMTGMIRYHTAERERDEIGRRNVDGLPHVPPPTPETGVHSMFWGAMAAFQIGRATWDVYNEAMKEFLFPRQDRGDCRRGSFAPGESRIGRPAATALGVMCFEFYYRYSSVFGAPGGGRGFERPRSDFPDLLIADLALPTDAEGRATIPLDLPDSVTTWALHVGAWDGKGKYGRAETSLKAVLDLEAGFDLPPRLREGDVLAVPVRVRSRGEDAQEVAVTLTTSEHLAVVGDSSQTVAVAPGGTATVRFVLEAKTPGTGEVLAVAVGEKKDSMVREVEILGNRHPFTIRFPLPLGRDTTLGSRVPRAGVEAMRARLEVRTSPLDDAEEALKGLVRRPTGCFEQTAATLYPSLLAYRYLKRIGTSDQRFEDRAMRILRLGYQRLLSYEVTGGGFSIWGKSPDEPDCNALAIHLLTDLAKVMEVDREVIDRAADRLAGTLPSVKSAAERVYAVAALRRAGRSLKDGYTLGFDPYPVALAAVHGLLPGDAREGARRQIEKSDWPKGGPTLFSGDHRDLTEVRATCTHALSMLGGDPTRILEELSSLRSAQQPGGAWATTRATVAALRCLLGLASKAEYRGVLTVKRAGEPDLSLPLDPGARGRSLDLGPWAPAARRLRVDFEGTGRPYLTVVLEGLSATPPAAAGELAAEVLWPKGPVPAALPVKLRVSLRNTTREVVHAPVLTIPLPAGFRASRESLENIVRRHRFDRAEVKAGSVHLYLDSLDERGKAEATLSLTPAFEGEFRVAPARCYPYYRPESVGRTEGGNVSVRR